MGNQQSADRAQDSPGWDALALLLLRQELTAPDRVAVLQCCKLGAQLVLGHAPYVHLSVDCQPASKSYERTAALLDSIWGHIDATQQAQEAAQTSAGSAAGPLVAHQRGPDSTASTDAPSQAVLDLTLRGGYRSDFSASPRSRVRRLTLSKAHLTPDQWLQTLRDARVDYPSFNTLILNQCTTKLTRPPGTLRRSAAPSVATEDRTTVDIPSLEVYSNERLLTSAPRYTIDIVTDAIGHHLKSLTLDNTALLTPCLMKAQDVCPGLTHMSVILSTFPSQEDWAAILAPPSVSHLTLTWKRPASNSNCNVAVRVQADASAYAKPAREWTCLTFAGQTPLEFLALVPLCAQEVRVLGHLRPLINYTLKDHIRQLLKNIRGTPNLRFLPATPSPSPATHAGGSAHITAKSALPQSAATGVIRKRTEEARVGQGKEAEGAPGTFYVYTVDSAELLQAILERLDTGPDEYGHELVDPRTLLRSYTVGRVKWPTLLEVLPEHVCYVRRELVYEKKHSKPYNPFDGLHIPSLINGYMPPPRQTVPPWAKALSEVLAPGQTVNRFLRLELAQYAPPPKPEYTSTRYYAAANPYRDPYDVRGMHPWTSEDESVVSTWLQSTGAQELMSVVLVEPPAA